MLPAVLRIHDGLLSSGRLPALARSGQRISASELALLGLMGAGAALAVAFIKFDKQIPGHAILQSVFPMALGLALVPRRGSGVVMGTSALATALLLKGLGTGGLGTGSLTSLCLTGPLLDVVLLRAGNGWRLYVAFMLAGLASNLIAFVVRGSFKASPLEPLTKRPLELWYSESIITYPVCGLLAGLISAVVWFHWRSRQDTVPGEGEPGRVSAGSAPGADATPLAGANTHDLPWH